MTSTLLVLLFLSQAERPDDPLAGAMRPPLPPMSGGWHYLPRLEDSGLALLPSGEAAGVDSYAQLTPMLVLDGGYLYSGEVRRRFGEWLYALGQGGMLLFPAPDGTLRPGAFASLGLGVDHAR
ncbi:hypothetical protein ACN28S_60730 [Cystobacter fuscus]